MLGYRLSEFRRFIALAGLAAAFVIGPATRLAVADGIAISAGGFAISAEKDEVKKLQRELAEIIKVQNAGRAAAFVTRLASKDDPDTVPLLLRAAVSLPSAANYERAVKGLSRFANEETVARLIALCAGKKRSKDFRERVLVIEAFGRRKDQTTLQAIFTVVREDKTIHVRIAAMRACVVRKEKDAVPILIDHVAEHERSRARDWIEARQALLDLTAQDFDSVVDWQNFWAANKDTLDPRNLDRKDGPTKVVVKKTKDSVEFFGAEILSQNVIFVIDCSGSMILYDEDPEYTGDNIKRDRERLARAKDQTISAIRKLRNRSRFNVIAYNSMVYNWQGKKKRPTKLVAASPGTQRAAQKFIRGFQANGLTHTDDGLEEAFKDPGVDTIVLLSDGAPTKQGMAGNLMETILKRVKDLNASRKLRIDTFGFEGQGINPNDPNPAAGGGGANANNPMVKFLKDLAEQNSGEYRAIK